MFGRPAFSGAMPAVLLSRVLTIGGSVYLVLYFSDGLGLSPTGEGLLMTPIFLAQIVMGMVGSQLIGHWAPGLVIGSGYALKGVGLAALALLITPDTPWWALLVPPLAWGAGGGIAGAPVMAVAVQVTAPERVGMVAGTVSTLASLGAGVGTAALGAVFALHGGHDAPGGHRRRPSRAGRLRGARGRRRAHHRHARRTAPRPRPGPGPLPGGGRRRSLPRPEVRTTGPRVWRGRSGSLQYSGASHRERDRSRCRTLGLRAEDEET